MRLIDRTDTPLVAGLITGAVIVFHQPLRFLLDAAREIEAGYHLDLVPALVVLSAVFVFHQYRKRRQSHAEMVAAAAEARQHLERAQELEALMAFGRALASALDVEGLRQAVWRCLPAFLGERGMWVMVSRQGKWESLAIDPVTSQEMSADDLERIATAALDSAATAASAHGEGVVIDSCLCFQLAVGNTALGVMAVRQTGEILDARARRALGVAASLLSIAVRNVHLLVETQELNIHDSLTGCINRKPGLETLDAELRRARRTKLPLSVLMLDVDEFKQINDRYGHLCGDLVLSTIGRHLRHLLRTSDIKCRYGGDEFILILPDTPLTGAEQVANGIGKAIMAQPIEYNGQAVSVTVSLGVACAEVGDFDVKAVIARADQALYSAKESGRNRSCSTSTNRHDAVPAGQAATARQAYLSQGSAA